MAGYSSTPVWKKLGYKPGLVAHVDEPPDGYFDLLKVAGGPEIDWRRRVSTEVRLVHVFVDWAAILAKKLGQYRGRIPADGVVWVSWPKKSSGVKTDVTEDVVRAVALPLGFVDIKVCAVDEIWSGLKLVVRKELR